MTGFSHKAGKGRAVLPGIFVGLFLLAMHSSGVHAQSSYTAQGGQELSLTGSFDFEAPNGDNINLRAGYGWYYQDDLLFKWDYQWVVSEDIAANNSDYRAQQGSFGTEYLFSNGGAAVPYIGVNVGWRNTKFGSVRESGLVIGPKAGFRYFLNDSVSIDSSVSLNFSNEDVFIVDFESTDSYIFPGVGISASF
ncbi:MAG: hypothetical protein ACI9LO_002425 [Planctomycetota bacterium]|jgi:hypothetical protein